MELEIRIDGKKHRFELKDNDMIVLRIDDNNLLTISQRHYVGFYIEHSYCNKVIASRYVHDQIELKEMLMGCKG